MEHIHGAQGLSPAPCAKFYFVLGYLITVSSLQSIALLAPRWVNLPRGLGHRMAKATDKMFTESERIEQADDSLELISKSACQQVSMSRVVL